MRRTAFIFVTYFLLLLLDTVCWPKDNVDDNENTSESITGTIIGIDLGGVHRPNGIGVEIIPNDQGNHITPSYVIVPHLTRRM